MMASIIFELITQSSSAHLLFLPEYSLYGFMLEDMLPNYDAVFFKFELILFMSLSSRDNYASALILSEPPICDVKLLILFVISCSASDFDFGGV